MDSLPPITPIVSVQYGFLAVPKPRWIMDGLFLRWFTDQVLRDGGWTEYWAQVRLDFGMQPWMRSDTDWISRCLEGLQDCTTTGYKVIIMEYIKAGAHDSPLSLVATWDGPEREQRVTMTGLECPHRAEDVIAARRALEIFREMDRRGRLPLEHDSESGWRERTAKAIEIKHRTPRLSWTVIAESHVGVSLATLKRWRERYARQSPE